MSSVEERLTAVESELLRLRQQVDSRRNWLASISGSMKDFQEFDEVLRLGREVRQRDYPASGNGKEGD